MVKSVMEVSHSSQVSKFTAQISASYHSDQRSRTDYKPELSKESKLQEPKNYTSWPASAVNLMFFL